MNKEEAIERVKNVVSGHLKVERDDIRDDSRFVEDLGADSVKSIELVALFEREFDVELDEEEALKVRDVAGAADFIMQSMS
jgi:acyl carrier protein